MNSRQPCAEKMESFCYVCGKFETKYFRRLINDSIADLYSKCYKPSMNNLDKPWVPKSICNSCRLSMTRWNDKTRDTFVVTQPTIWREPMNHANDCYFCLCKIIGFNKRNSNNITYPNVKSVTTAIRGIRGEYEMEIDPPAAEPMDFHPEEDIAFEEATSDDGPKLFGQAALDDLIRDLNLPKDRAELCASRLKERNLLLPGTKVTVYRKREKMFIEYFSMDENIVYCNDIEGLINLYIADLYKPDDWRLFIDSSTESLKAVLLHNGNKYASIPVGHSTVLKESYNSFQLLLHKLKYEDHKWLICGDFKMINLIVGLQSGNTKYPCFLCLWDSRARDQHWVREKWPARTDWNVGYYNVSHESLVDRGRVLLPPLHIKLGLMKQFVKALDHKRNCYKYITSSFPKLTKAKISEGVFVGPDIRKLMNDKNFIKKMNAKEKDAWLSFKEVTQKFLGNNRDPKYKTIASIVLRNYQKLGCNMSLKLHFLKSHLSYFPENVGAFSEEMGERFHQDFHQKEKHYQGRWDEAMMADYCWSLKRENNNSEGHKRKPFNDLSRLKESVFIRNRHNESNLELSE